VRRACLRVAASRVAGGPAGRGRGVPIYRGAYPGRELIRVAWFYGDGGATAERDACTRHTDASAQRNADRAAD